MNNATAIAAGDDATCVIIDDGSVVCWDGDDAPAPVVGLDAATDIAVGGSSQMFACAIQAGGVYCWGNNENGQLGDGTLFPRTTVGDPITF